MAKANANPTPALQTLIAAEPDLVDRIFDYLLAELPEFSEAVLKPRLVELKGAVRTEFAGDRQRISPRTAAGRRTTAQEILSLFNGRNAREVARRLGISRATVYRVIKQAGAGEAGQNSLIPGRNETRGRIASEPVPTRPT